MGWACGCAELLAALLEGGLCLGQLVYVAAGVVGLLVTRVRLVTLGVLGLWWPVARDSLSYGLPCYGLA